MRLEFTTDPARFLEVAADHLAEQPVVTTVVSTVAQRTVMDLADGVDQAPGDWYVVVREGGDVCAAAMRTAPFGARPPYLLPMSDDAASPPAFGVARIGPVYTPKAQRGRGFASAAVAEVSRRIVASGSRACLFTDQANPTSNRVYEALGYRPVVDMANLLVRC